LNCGLEWVRSIQNFDGGWGESCDSYRQGSYVAAPSTPSQTAWAVLALLAGGDTTSRTLHDGIDYLIRTQNNDGTWEEELATGTGFPQVFYLCYHLYRNSFPLLALNTFLKLKTTIEMPAQNGARREMVAEPRDGARRTLRSPEDKTK